MKNCLFRLSVFTFLLFACNRLSAQHHSFFTDTTVQYIDFSVSPYNSVQGGDTLFLRAGNRNKIKFKNLHGQAGNPVFITNSGGSVRINTADAYGIAFSDCSYFHLSGQSPSPDFYGIQILSVAGGAGLGIGDRSSDFEVDHIRIENCKTDGQPAERPISALLNT